MSLGLAALPLSWSQETSTDENIFELSPFEVTTSAEDVGYRATTTLAGSRLNTNVGDLAASITIVTKQQLDDTGAIDINDVFLYESNTEGAGTYTPAYLNRGNIRDVISGFSDDNGQAFGIATANRVRGLGSVDTAQNNYPTIARLAFDTYNSNSVEINRGPNSLLFGIGSPAGIVNQSTSEAILGHNGGTLNMRIGSWESYRASISGNLSVTDKLAVYAAGLYDHRGFQRKPTKDDYRRQYVTATYKPFEKTKLTVSYEHYDNFNNRPNYATPIDYVSPWLEAGRPGYNPTTQMITVQDTGQVMGPYLLNRADPRWDGSSTVGTSAFDNLSSTLYYPGIQYRNHNQLLFDQGQVVGFWIDSPNGIALDRPATSALTAEQWIAYSTGATSSRGYQAGTPPVASGATAYGSWYDKGVSDKSIYNWEKINVQSANYGTQEAETYNIELQQEILPNLHLSAGWFRQELEEWSNFGLGQANQALRLYVDTNTHNRDGSANPYFGSPYVLDYQPDTFYTPETNDVLRAMLAYTVDFTDDNGWTKWLGRHRFLGLASRRKTWANNLRYRLSYDGGDSRLLPTGTNYSWAANAGNLQRHFYLGQNEYGVVEHGAGFVESALTGGLDSATIHIYNWANGSWEQSDMSFQPNLMYAGSNYGVRKTKLDSKSFTWQGYLWEERIITTFGWRDDTINIQQYTSAGLSNTDWYNNGYGVEGVWNHMGEPVEFSGTTSTKGIVFKPFHGWDSIKEGSFWGDFLSGFTLHYNKSDNFNAPSSITTDFFGNVLPKPSGEGKDWGIGVSMLEDKLVLRLNFFESTNKYAPASAASTPIMRTVRIDTGAAQSWARYVVRMRHGQDPTTVGFDDLTLNPLTTEMEGEIESMLGHTLEWPTTNISGTESNEAKGAELQLIYNPIRNWTIKLTAGKQETTYSDSVGELQDWLAERLPYWKSLTSEFTGEYIQSNGIRLKLDDFWNGYGFHADARAEATNGWVSPAGFYASVVEGPIYQAIAQEGTVSANQRKWTSTILTNYAFTNGRFKGIAVGGSLRWADKAAVGYYGLEDPNYYSHPNASQYLINLPDLDRPIYTPAETHIDLWASYSTKILNDKVRMKLQLNIRDVTENGGLQAILYNFDGTPAQYRIKDPRQFIFSSTFEF